MTYIKNKNIESFPTIEASAVFTANDILINNLKAFPGFVGTVLPAMASLGSSVSPTAMVSGRLWQIHFTIPRSIVVTGVKYNMYTAGQYTANNTNGVCLYSDNAGVLTKVTGSELTGASFWTTLGLNTVPFSSPLTLNAGNYKLLFLWNASATTTAPSIWNWGGISPGGIPAVLGNSNQFSSSLSATTSFATSLNVSSLSSAQSVLPMFWLY